MRQGASPAARKSDLRCVAHSRRALCVGNQVHNCLMPLTAECVQLVDQLLLVNLRVFVEQGFKPPDVLGDL